MMYVYAGTWIQLVFVIVYDFVVGWVDGGNGWGHKMIYGMKRK